jgi:hypothetical protein
VQEVGGGAGTQQVRHHHPYLVGQRKVVLQPGYGSSRPGLSGSAAVGKSLHQSVDDIGTRFEGGFGNLGDFWPPWGR